MYANNEVGTIQPIADDRRAGPAPSRACLIHVDAVQAAPWIAARPRGARRGPREPGRRTSSRVPAASASSTSGTAPHILAQEHGGSQERHRRAGHRGRGRCRRHGHRVRPGARTSCRRRSRRVRRLRERLQQAVLAVDGTELTGHPTDRLPGILSFIARGTDGNAIVLALDLAGRAPAPSVRHARSGSTEASHVLTAMGYPEDEARGSLRAVARPDHDPGRHRCRGGDRAGGHRPPAAPRSSRWRGPAAGSASLGIGAGATAGAGAGG